jgi:serine/threonine protein kinase
MRHLPHTASIRWPDQPFNFLRRTFPELSEAGLRLLNGLLTYDAGKRMTAAEALEHEYFRVRRHARYLSATGGLQGGGLQGRCMFVSCVCVRTAGP